MSYRIHVMQTKHGERIDAGPLAAQRVADQYWVEPAVRLGLERLARLRAGVAYYNRDDFGPLRVELDRILEAWEDDPRVREDRLAVMGPGIVAGSVDAEAAAKASGWLSMLDDLKRRRGFFLAAIDLAEAGDEDAEISL